MKICYFYLMKRSIWYSFTLFCMLVRYAGFWHSGRLFALLQMPSLQNLNEFFGDTPLPPFKLSIFVPFDLLFQAIFLSCPIPRPRYLIKENEQSLKKDNCEFSGVQPGTFKQYAHCSKFSPTTFPKSCPRG